MSAQIDNSLIHFATGGISHFLKLLGNSILFGEQNRLRVSVVSEYHQPLARLPLNHIFELGTPLVPFESLSSRSRLKAMNYRPKALSGGSVLRSIDGKHSYSGALNREICFSRMFNIESYFTTGVWPIGIGKPKKPSMAESHLASLRSLTLREQYIAPIQTRAELLQEPYIGVHFRNTDHTHDLESTVHNVLKVVREKHLNLVYWCTDDASSIEKAKELLSGVRVLHNQPFSASGMKNLHYGVRGEDSVSHLKNTFADLWTLSNSYDSVMTSGSWAHLVPLLRAPEVADGFFGFSSSGNSAKSR